MYQKLDYMTKYGQSSAHNDQIFDASTFIRVT